MYQQTDVKTRSTVDETTVHSKLQKQNETTELSNVRTTPVQVTATPLQNETVELSNVRTTPVQVTATPLHETNPSTTVAAKLITATTQPEHEGNFTSNANGTKSTIQIEKTDLPSTASISNSTKTEKPELQGKICICIYLKPSELVFSELVFIPMA